MLCAVIHINKYFRQYSCYGYKSDCTIFQYYDHNLRHSWHIVETKVICGLMKKKMLKLAIRGNYCDTRIRNFEHVRLLTY
jgi:hypothetical protein